MNEGMENLKQIAELEEKCMKDKTLIVKSHKLQAASAMKRTQLKSRIKI